MKIFVDGSEGTTGLKINERLKDRDDIILKIPPDKRKDINTRRELINEADFVFLCLPDAAAREAVALAENPNTRIIDASTAHRTDPRFAYGFPELSPKHKENIKNSRYIAVPGCHASGVIALLYPLIKKGLLPPEALVSCHSVTGYSGGGKKMIAAYEDPGRPASYNSPRQYALGQTHKHLPEITYVTGLKTPPVFSPIVADFYAGMVVTVPLHMAQLNRRTEISEIHRIFVEYYAGCDIIEVVPAMGAGVLEDGFLDASALAGQDNMQIFVCGTEDRIILASRFDNLGKGSSGAAIQCLDIASV